VDSLQSFESQLEEFAGIQVNGRATDMEFQAEIFPQDSDDAQKIPTPSYADDLRVVVAK
jgi:hypothetical protein